MAKELNAQINKETFSAYYYFSMAAWAENENFGGVASFFKKQAQEELGHAMKIYGYVNERGNAVILEAIEKPKTDFASVEELFALALEHEKYVTSSINDLVSLAIKENDYATKTFLDWFVTEQVEEEASMDSILAKLKLAGKSGQALLMLDNVLGQR